MGLDNFLVVGDVYRRDAVDSSHYPVFHQMEGVRLFQPNTFFDMVKGPKTHLQLFEKDGVRTNGKQETHTIDSVVILEHDLKDCLLGLAKHLFGPGNPTLYHFMHLNPISNTYLISFYTWFFCKVCSRFFLASRASNHLSIYRE